MEQKELLVIVNGNYQRIVNCRSFFRPNRPGRPREDADDVKLATYKCEKRGSIFHEMHVMIILFRFCIWAFCTCYFYIPGSVCTMSLFIRCHVCPYLTTPYARM